MAQKTELLEDDALHGVTWSPPAFTLILGGIFVGVGLYCNVQQITTSTDAFFSALQSLANTGKFSCPAHVSVQACVGLAQQWTQAKLSAMNPKLLSMAQTLAVVVQCFMLSQGIPISRIYHQMKVKNAGTSLARTVSAVGETATHLSFWQWLGLLAFAADVLGDVRYGLMMSNDIITVLLWALFLAAGSTLLLLNGVQRLWGAGHEWWIFHKEKKATA